MTTLDLIGCSPKFRAVLTDVERIAPVDSAVLIQGETGTGKEVIARAIHEASPRRNQRFVALNCAAIPSALLESELFGHERGAFTGACTQTKGRFQMADGGTLFLDEIGDMPLELQPKLLRALQEREFERLGSTQTVRVNVRVVAATNQDLGQLVSKRLFRADLFYRLNVIPICLPPLRERVQDILPAAARGQHQHADQRMRGQQAPGNLGAVQVRQVHVEQHDIGPGRGGDPQRLCPVGRGPGYRVARLGQVPRGAFPPDRVIVHDQHAHRRPRGRRPIRFCRHEARPLFPIPARMSGGPCRRLRAAVR